MIREKFKDDEWLYKYFKIMSDIKYRNTFEHDSFLGFLNAFKVKDTNWILKAG